MNTAVILIGTDAFAALFADIIPLTYRGGGKHGAGAIHNYLSDIREEL